VAQVVRALDGRRLAVESLGAPAHAAKTVFLMHGTPGSLNGPRPRGIYLYRLGIRLISYNRPGYAGSDPRIDRSVADAAEDVQAIADAFGIDQFSVIGRSGGAPHALACAAAKSLKGRVVCAAALGSLAPYHAKDLDWKRGMAPSNVAAYRDAEDNLASLIATLNERRLRLRNNPQSLLDMLWPELVGADKQVIGDIALRRIIAQTHAEALRESASGWIDDVIALSRPWEFELSDITVPVLLWYGRDDVFSPASHTQWLAKEIRNADTAVRSGIAHFGAVEILPEILGWVTEKMNAARHGGRTAKPVPVPARR
jgi:pimeloyl-ACP methyl ester carboxylesterase